MGGGAASAGGDLEAIGATGSPGDLEPTTVAGSQAPDRADQLAFASALGAMAREVFESGAGELRGEDDVAGGLRPAVCDRQADLQPLADDGATQAAELDAQIGPCGGGGRGRRGLVDRGGTCGLSGSPAVRHRSSGVTDAYRTFGPL